MEREFAIIRSPTQQAVSAGAGRGPSGGDHGRSGAAASRAPAAHFVASQAGFVWFNEAFLGSALRPAGRAVG